MRTLTIVIVYGCLGVVLTLIGIMLVHWRRFRNETDRSENGPIRIDIRSFHGLETAPSRAVGRFRDKSHFATFG